MKTKEKVKCPYCTQQVGTQPVGGGWAMVSHTTRRNGQGSECYGSRRRP